MADNYTIMKDVHERMDKYMEIEEERQIRVKERKQDNIKYWITYSITTLIAIAALVNSILARLGL